MLLILNMVLVLVGPFVVLAPLAVVALVQFAKPPARPARVCRRPVRSPRLVVAW
jgi:hypothetical protein